MARVVTSDELTLFHTPGDWDRFNLAIHVPRVIYSAQVDGVPDSDDMVNFIDFDGGNGDPADIHPDMMMYIGTAAGKRDLGEVRLRKTPTSSRFYFTETSSVVWADDAYLTVVERFAIRERALRSLDGALVMDSEVTYDDQHENFDPVPVLGPHRVVEMTGASVDVTLGAPSDTPSWVFDSTITGQEWTIPAATAIDDASAVNPVATFETTGWHACYCVVTADNGKSFEGVRWVYVWNKENPPARAFSIPRDPEADYDNGGYSYDVDMSDEAHLDEVRDGAEVILFARDHYGDIEQSIGPIEGCENQVIFGWIAGESIDWDPETYGKVTFTVEGPQYWMKKNVKYALELTFATETPDSWKVMPNLTVDRALWHLLHWRFNVTKLMDVILSGDERRASQLKSNASSLWSQINDLASKKIFARPGCDRYGRLFVQVDPQMVPEADRDWPIVQTLTKKDWEGKIDFERKTEPQNELCILFASGEMVDDSGSSNILYSITPGHSPMPYGDSDIIDGLLVEDQTQANEQAGLQLGWRNNELPEIPIDLSSNNRMIDLWPRQFAAISIAEEDTVRGIAYDGNLIPRSITLRIDAESGTLTPSITFETETFAMPAVTGDPPPDSGLSNFDMSVPPLGDISLADIQLQDFGYSLPSSDATNPNRAKWAAIKSSDYGILYTKNADEEDPNKIKWNLMNEGLTTYESTHVFNLEVTKDGHVFAYVSTGGFLPRAVYAATLGGIWKRLLIETSTLSIVDMRVDPNRSNAVALAVAQTTTPSHSDLNIWFGNSDAVAFASNIPNTNTAGQAQGQLAWIAGELLVFAINTSMSAHVYAHRCSLEGVYSSRVDTGIINDLPSMENGHGRNTIYAKWVSGDLYIIQDRGATIIDVPSNSPYTGGITSLSSIAPSPDASIVILTDQSGSHLSYISNDGGITFASLGGTIPAGSTIWENCGDNNRWLFGSGIVIRQTLDKGLTYIELGGNLSYIAPLINIEQIRFIK